MAYTIHGYADYQPSEILNLYESVGWCAYTRDPSALRRSFEKSLLVLAAYEGDRLIGIIRTVGDSETIVFIQDLLVHPDHQHKGVGSALVRAVLERFPGVRQIQLTADNAPATLSFYNSCGFLPHAAFDCVGFMAQK